MSLSHLGEPVTVVNRLRDANGRPIPWDIHVDGDCITITESTVLPAGVARIAIQGSMFAFDPQSLQGDYRLGVADWDMPVTPLPLAELQKRIELIERTKLPPDRQFGWKSANGKTFSVVRTSIPQSRRHDPLALSVPGPHQDGALPAGFGDRI